MKADFDDYAGRKVLRITAKTKLEKKQLNDFLERCESAFEVLDRNRTCYVQYTPIKINGAAIDADGCRELCVESINLGETKDVVYAKSLEMLRDKKPWWKLW